MILPNFLIVGAAKAGTTTLYEHLAAHPEVFMPDLKEPRFFAYNGRGADLKYPVKTLNEYALLFEGAGKAKAIGEASTHYLYVPEAANRIREVLPGVRIIVSLRDPVARSFSVYQMNMRNSGANEGLSFLEAFERDPALRQGYREALRRYLKLFAPERVKVVLFDDLVRDTPGVVGDLLAFLEVAPDRTPIVPRVANPGGIPRRRLLHAMLNNRRVRAFGRRHLPKPLVNAARRIRSRNLEKQELSREERAAALAFFRDDIAQTQDLIERDLSAWLKI